MITNLKQIETLSGLALTQKLGIGKHKGKHLWELPDDYLRYCAKNGYFDYDKVRAKIEESKTIKLIDPIKSVLPVYTESDLSDWLYPYQKRELMRFPGRSRIIINGCIGSGKTIMALELARLYGYRKTLITVPKTVHSSWINKIMDRTNQSYIRLNGSLEERAELLLNTNYTFYLINQESFTKYETKEMPIGKIKDRQDKMNKLYQDLLEAVILARVEFAFFDESHLYLQNHSTATYKNIKLMLQYVPHPYLMTGTFFSEGREERAVDQLHLINPSLFADRPITTIYKERFILDDHYKPVMLDPKFIPALTKLIANNSMVIHSDELKLPKPIFQTHEIEMHGDLWRAYQKAEREMLIEMQSDDVSIPAKIALITRLRQISGGSVLDQRFKDNDKLTELKNVVSEYGGDPFIIGCQYKDEIEIIKDKLKSYKIAVISGDITGVNRDKAINDFRNKRVQCLIIQLDSGIGLDGLQDVCRFCVIYSGTYQSSKLEQFYGRLVRVGQMTNAVFTFLRHVRPDGNPSIDEIMAAAVDSKNEKTEEFMNMIMEKRKSA